MKSDAAAFQELTAKKMSRFVTLCALTRLQCRTPSQRPTPPLGHDRKHAGLRLTGQTREVDEVDAGGRLKPALRIGRLFDISVSSERSRVKGYMTGSVTPTPSSRLSGRSAEMAASLLPCRLNRDKKKNLHHENKHPVQTAGPDAL